MRFTTRELFIGIGVFAIWLAIVAQGYQVFGPEGAVVGGLFSGIAIAVAVHLFWYWKSWNRWQRASHTIAVLAAALAMAYLTYVHRKAGAHLEWQQIRRVERLQQELNLDPDYERVRLTYVPRGFRRSARWVVEGTVDTQNDLKMLQEKVGELLPHADWNVEVDPKTARH